MNKTLLVAALFLAALPLASPAQISRMELITIPSSTLTDPEFLTGRKEGKPVSIVGALRIPRPGTQKQPAIVLVHGSGGISGSVADWEPEFNAMGIATFTIDSFTPRGVTSVINDQGLLGRLIHVEDAFRALEVLEKHPRIDPERIAVIGFSRGGQGALYAASRRFQRAHGPASGREYAAYIALYPTCNVPYKNDEEVSKNPIRIFHGAADDYVPASWCRDYAARLKAKGSDVVHMEFPGAHHVFDAVRLKTPQKMERAHTTRNCKLEEGPEGVVVNAKTGQAFSYSDPCVERGVTIQYDEQASNATRKAIRELLTSLFKL